MKSIIVTIEIEHGLHVRPSAEFAEQAKKFSSEITLDYKGQSVSAKSIFNLQKLDLAQGVQVTLNADGPDEESALSTLSQILQPSLKNSIDLKIAN